MPEQKHKPAELREACVEEALAIIGEQGLEGLSLREVARRLGVSHQAPYKHFRSRDHILAEVVSRSYAAFAAYLDRRPRSADPWEDMCGMGVAYIEYARVHPLHYRLMFETPLPDPAEHPEMMRLARHAFSLLQDSISRLPGREGTFEDSLDALFVWSAMHGLCGILRGGAVGTLDLSVETLASAPPHVLRRIGEALASVIQRAGKQDERTLS